LKKVAVFLAVLMLTLSLSAQSRTGVLQGRAVNKDGAPLAGVKVTLSRPLAADQGFTTGAAGAFRFPAVLPASDYTLKAELADFKTTVRSGVIVEAGGRLSLDLVLQPGKPEETVSVTAPVPAVDPTRFTQVTSFGYDVLQTLPTARDPGAVLQLAPGILLDRENVGGNESGLQARILAKGDKTNGGANTWTIDGVDVTDPVDLGASAIHYDFDAIDTIQVTTGGAADVTQQTGGVAVNILTRRAGNKLAGTVRFFLTDDTLQSSNLTSDLRSAGVTNTNKIQQFRDYGASAGGPIVKNRLWFWGGFGVQDLFAYTIYNTQDRVQFHDYSLKLNAEPLTGNRFEVLLTTSQEERFGINAGAAKPEGDHQWGRSRLGSPIFKLQDEQVFGKDLYLSAKFTWASTGTNTKPMVDEDMTNPVVWDVANGLYVPFSSGFGRSWDYSISTRSRKDTQIDVRLYKDDFMGLSHEFKAGFAATDKKATSVSGYPQNYEVFRNFNEPLIDLGEGLVVPPSDWQRFLVNRENRQTDLLGQTTAYIQDTIAKGRFALQLGLRYDYQNPSLGATGIATVVSSWTNIFDQDLMTALTNDLPSLMVSAIDPKYEWSTWSPRLGLSWDLKGDGKTILRLSLAQYGDILTPGANVPRPLGLTGGLGFWWNDADADSLVDPDEAYWQYSSTHAETPNQLYVIFDEDGALTEAAAAALEGGFTSDAYLAGNYWGYDWDNKEAINYDNLTTFYRSDVDPDAKNVKTSPRTREIMLSLEKELRPDLAASVTATYRRYDNFDWAKSFYPADIYPETPDLVIDNTGTWFAVAGTIPATIEGDDVTIDMGDAAGRSWYLPIASFPGATPYRMVDKSTSHRDYFGLDLAVTKRLSHRWFLNASLTLQDQRSHWGDSFIDPTNQWALDGQPYGNWSDSFNYKLSSQMSARWLTKVSALYQLPLGLDASATLVAREGWKIPHYITFAYENSENWPGLYRANTIYIQAATKDSLPAMVNLSFRLEKKFTVGSTRMWIMADVFNLLNRATVNRATDANFGVYYVDTETYVASPYNRVYNEILNPRTVRLGVRFEF
jgi:hypothetical protein